MFEKEAEEYRIKAFATDKDYESIATHWRNGAEFGYNKANEWHYVKDELPKKTGRFLILNRFGEHYFTTNVTEYLEGAKMFSCFSMKDVYAWKEIILPELKESE